MKTIKVSLNKASIKQSLDEIKLYRLGVINATTLICKELTYFAQDTAEKLFQTADYDDIIDVNVTSTIKTIRDKRCVATITAFGADVCFIEFGAGIHNDTSYPIAKPSGIVEAGGYDLRNGLGTHQISWGNKEEWMFEGKVGDLVITKGYDAQKPMYNTIMLLRKMVVEQAKKVMQEI